MLYQPRLFRPSFVHHPCTGPPTTFHHLSTSVEERLVHTRIHAADQELDSFTGQGF